MKKKFECYFCKKEFIDWEANRPCKRVFCSRKCKGSFMKTQTGQQAIHWKNARTNHNGGYFIITRECKPQLEHRFVMEEFLGRKLSKNEHIHHLNGNKKDNKLENLILLTNSEHKRLHLMGNKHAQRYFPQKYINCKLSEAWEKGLIKPCQS